MPRIDHHFFRQTTTGEQRTNSITDLPVATGTHFADDAGTFQSENIAGTRWWRVQPGTLQQVGTVQARGRHANAYFTHITGRSGTLCPFHLPFHALQCFHAASIVHLNLAQRLALGFCIAPMEPGALKDGLICVINCPRVESA